MQRAEPSAVGVAESGSIEHAVRARLTVGDQVSTARGVVVNVPVIDDRGVVLWVRGEPPERSTWRCLQLIADRLAAGEPLPRCAQSLSISWVRALLEAAQENSAES
jgi:hypothetical protein